MTIAVVGWVATISLTSQARLIAAWAVVNALFVQASWHRQGITWFGDEVRCASGSDTRATGVETVAGHISGVVALVCCGALRLSTMLAEVGAIGCYARFRPDGRDHLSVIDADPRVDGLFHASGHEGTGIGLAQPTGHPVAVQATGATLKVGMAQLSDGRSG